MAVQMQNNGRNGMRKYVDAYLWNTLQTGSVESLKGHITVRDLVQPHRGYRYGS